MKSKFVELGLIAGILGVVISAFAQTWTQTSAPTNHALMAIASSADGKVICALCSASPPVLSTNSGDIWTTNVALPYGYTGVASSADGTRLLATYGVKPLFMSTNSGLNWFQTTSLAADWRGLASSADGSKLFAGVSRSSFLLSTNFGADWQVGNLNNIWSIATSADGTKLLAASSSGQIYISTNTGNSWQLATVGGYSVATSADGNILAVTGNPLLFRSTVYVSTNSGSSWITNAFSGYAVASSADGKKLIVAGADGLIYYSADFGSNWTSNTVPINAWSLAMSADGCKMVAAARGVWKAQVPPAPLLNLAPTNGRLAFSWTVPSTNFILQRKVDLSAASWVTLTNKPALNFTNLQDEVTLSSSNSSGFFRLVSQ